MKNKIVEMAQSGEYTMRGIARELKMNPTTDRNICKVVLTHEEYEKFTSKGKKCQQKNEKEIMILLDKNGNFLSAKGAPYKIFREVSQ